MKSKSPSKVIHNLSPDTKFYLSCKNDTWIASQLCLSVQNPAEEPESSALSQNLCASFKKW